LDENKKLRYHLRLVVWRLSRSTKLTYVCPVSTWRGNRVRVQFPVPDIYLATQVNSARPSVGG